ncbi:MAG: DNRLRE domain-containing protein [Crocinitomicaceae bacterium]
MKKYFSLIALLVLSQISIAQVTAVLQPNAADGKDALLANCIPCGYLNTNYGTGADFATAGWTNSGAESDLRSIIEFDFTSIPAQSTVVSATLSFYHNPNSQNGTHSSLTGSNEATLKRVLSAWDENTVTWANQPSTTSVNEVYIPQSTSSSQNYTSIDVTILVQDMINNPTSNFGFLLQSISEDPYKRLIFASSDHPNSELHPKINIVYREASPSIDTCLVFQPSSEIGKDAIIESRLQNNNFGNHSDLYSISWTNGGVPVDGRSLIEFDLSAIPLNVNLLSAELSLYGQNSPANGSHSNLSGPNESVIQRVTQAWDENTVAWNSQPSSTSVNQVNLPATTSAVQNFIDIDVLPLTQDMVGGSNNNYGFLIKLVTESYYRRMVFASSDHPNASKHPKLKICYSVGPALISENQELEFSIFPNPSSNSIQIKTNGSLDYKLQIYDSRGRLILNSDFNESEIVDVSQFSTGVYMVNLSSSGQSKTKKLVIE